MRPCVTSKETEKNSDLVVGKISKFYTLSTFRGSNMESLESTFQGFG